MSDNRKVIDYFLGAESATKNKMLQIFKNQVLDLDIQKNGSTSFPTEPSDIEKHFTIYIKDSGHAAEFFTILTHSFDLKQKQSDKKLMTDCLHCLLSIVGAEDETSPLIDSITDGIRKIVGLRQSTSHEWSQQHIKNSTSRAPEAKYWGAFVAAAPTWPNTTMLLGAIQQKAQQNKNIMDALESMAINVAHNLSLQQEGIKNNLVEFLAKNPDCVPLVLEEIIQYPSDEFKLNCLVSLHTLASAQGYQSNEFYARLHALHNGVQIALSDVARKELAHALDEFGLKYERGQGLAPGFIAPDYDTAMKYYYEAYQHNKHDTKVLNRIGNLHLRRFAHDEALHCYCKAAKLGSTYALDAINNIGRQYQTGEGISQDQHKALQCFFQAYKYNENYPKTLMNLGNIHQASRNYVVAKSYYSAAAKQGHYNALDALNDLGYGYQIGESVAQDYDQAMACYNEAYQYDKTNVRTLENIKCLRQLIILQNKLTNVLTNLAASSSSTNSLSGNSFFVRPKLPLAFNDTKLKERCQTPRPR